MLLVACSKKVTESGEETRWTLSATISVLTTSNGGALKMKAGVMRGDVCSLW